MPVTPFCRTGPRSRLNCPSVVASRRAGTVVTCAHVVEDVDRVTVRWSGPDLAGRVLVRDPPVRQGTRFYPPPDIAFVGVDTLDNPSAYLETSPQE